MLMLWSRQHELADEEEAGDEESDENADVVLLPGGARTSALSAHSDSLCGQAQL